MPQLYINPVNKPLCVSGALFYWILNNAAYYDNGIAFADDRINENSASYTAGYNVGKQNEFIFLGNERSYNVAEFVGAENVRNYNNSDFFVTYGTACPFTNIYLTACSINEEFSWTYNSNNGTLSVNGGTLNYTYSYMGYSYNETLNLTPAVYMFK